ncbi:hypothetical protein [Singulisphaera sp. PoT]|uniref:hypothetical protein n=1 Tax=Singulisphaera sp. PoT TaxID=3411797 RepID=UPI003BF5C8A8
MAKNPGLGTKLKHGVAGTPPVYSEIAQVSKISGPGGEVGTRETTDLDSTAKEYEPTLYDGGEISFTVYYDPVMHALLFTLWTTPSKELWQLVFNDSVHTTFSFKAILTKFSPTGMEVEGNLEAEITIKISGPVTSAAGS